jgi:spore coat protein U-like protein
MKKKAAMLQITKEKAMRKITSIVIMVLAVCVIMACKADVKPDVKIVEEKIAADIEHSLQEAAADMGLAGVKLKNAPKSSGNTWVGTVTFASGSGKWDDNIAANHYSETNTVTWWYVGSPDDKYNVSLEAPVSQKANLSTFQIKNDTGLWTFYEVYVSYNHSDNWGKDQLGDDVLEPGGSLKITSSLSLNKVTIDFLIMDEDGDTYTIYDKKVKNGGVVKITLADLDLD